MIQQHGGLHGDPGLQALVDAVGRRIVERSDALETPWEFEFHLLADPDTVNAFALPGGQVFITMALFARLETEGQLAGVLGHEVGHVVARHSAQRMAKSQLTEGLMGAVVVATESARSAQVAAVIGGLVNMKYGRDDELESDSLGVRFTSDAGYDPRAMIRVMEILAEASGGARQPEFFSTHPNPENRIGRIEQAIRERFPNGVPEGLEE
jgi:predicted Zn-dependent protease